jgi:hypothetical protein
MAGMKIRGKKVIGAKLERIWSHAPLNDGGIAW